jgi:mitochondrial import receptor subunit TOM40
MSRESFHLPALETSATHLSNYIFDGARADLTKSLSADPLFQVTHSFALGSQTLPSSYNFGAIFANQKVFSELCVLIFV